MKYRFLLLLAALAIVALSAQAQDEPKIPAKVLPKTTTVARLAEFALKDNANFGEDDIDALTADWQDFPIEEWGIEIPDLAGIDIDEFFTEDTTEKDKAVSHTITLSYSTERECEEGFSPGAFTLSISLTRLSSKSPATRNASIPLIIGTLTAPLRFTPPLLFTVPVT